MSTIPHVLLVDDESSITDNLSTFLTHSWAQETIGSHLMSGIR